MASWQCMIVLSFLALASTSQCSSPPPEKLTAAGTVQATHDDEDGNSRFPLVISTWAFVEAARAAWTVVDKGGSSLDAVVEGCSTCEELRCDFSVGYGGSPDEAGETTLDAMIMDGTTMDVGAVGALRSVKHAIRVARLVLDHSEHSLLVGDQASAFALSLGIPGPYNLSTEYSLEQWSTWRDYQCQPNFRKNVVPDSRISCGPYRVPSDDPYNQIKADSLCMPGGCSDTNLKAVTSRARDSSGFSDHDTISLAVIDREGKIAVGTSTNGASHKIPGRVGDGPIAGAAAYADDDVGACGATGDGDVMMRFLPCYQVVESMRRGKSPKSATRDAIERIKRKYPDFQGAVFAVNRKGKHAGAGYGWTFQYTVRANGMEDVEIHTVSPLRD
ncbi:unnamed protein product [Calypogeia fissa]